MKDQMEDTITFLNGISLRLDIQGSAFRGIGAVSYRGVPVRSSKLPWTIYTESEHFEGAVRFEAFTLTDVRKTDEEVELMLRSKGCWMPRAQAADAMVEARIKT